MELPTLKMLIDNCETLTGVSTLTLQRQIQKYHAGTR
jgi:hypothetical protein